VRVTTKTVVNGEVVDESEKETYKRETEEERAQRRANEDYENAHPSSKSTHPLDLP